jgi:hypothetical protein
MAMGFPRTESILAALLLSLSLESLLSPFFVLSDTLFAFLLVFTIYALVSFFKNNRWPWLVSTALLSGLAILCRPVAIAYEIVVALVLFLNLRVRFWKRAFHAAVYLALLFALFVVPWAWHNKQAIGVATFTTKSGDFWLFWSAAPLEADIHHISVDQAAQDLQAKAEEILRQRGLEPTEANLLVRYVFIHLRYDLQNLLPGLGYAVNYLGISRGDTQGVEVFQSQGLGAVIKNYFGGQTIYILIFAPFMVLLLVTYIGAAAGTVNLIQKHNWTLLAVLILTAGYFLLAPGYASNSRYRIPAMPFLTLLAGPGLLMLWNNIKSKWPRKINPDANPTTKRNGGND